MTPVITVPGRASRPAAEEPMDIAAHVVAEAALGVPPVGRPAPRRSFQRREPAGGVLADRSFQWKGSWLPLETPLSERQPAVGSVRFAMSPTAGPGRRSLTRADASLALVLRRMDLEPPNWGDPVHGDKLKIIWRSTAPFRCIPLIPEERVHGRITRMVDLADVAGIDFSHATQLGCIRRSHTVFLSIAWGLDDALNNIPTMLR